MDLDLADWERVNGDEQRASCSDVETDGEWVWGVGGGILLSLLMGRRLGQSEDFNLCAGSEREPYRTKYVFDDREKPRSLQWALAVAEGRVGHLFYLDEEFEFGERGGKKVWKVFLRADGLGSWHRLAQSRDEDSVDDFQNNEQSSFQWHREMASQWLERPALDWFATFRTQVNESDSDVAFAVFWASKENDERRRLSLSTRRGNIEEFLDMLRLAVVSDGELWTNAHFMSCQFQLTDDDESPRPYLPARHFWLFDARHIKIERTERLTKLGEAAITYFWPSRGGALASSYSCIRQWLDENAYTVFTLGLEAPTQHESIEALLELREMLCERGMDWQNLLA